MSLFRKKVEYLFETFIRYHFIRST